MRRSRHLVAAKVGVIKVAERIFWMIFPRLLEMSRHIDPNILDCFQSSCPGLYCQILAQNTLEFPANRSRYTAEFPLAGS